MIPALLGLAGAALGPIGNIVSTAIANKQNLELQRMAWERENNAVQRRVADLRAAGMNPVLAAGSSAASMSPVRVGSADVSGFSEMVPKAIAARVAGLNMAQTEAETRRVQAEADKAETEANLKRREFDTLLRRSDLFGGKFGDMNLLQIGVLSDVLTRSVKPELTGTNLETALVNLELLKKYGSADAIMGLIGKGVGALGGISKVPSALFGGSR